MTDPIAIALGVPWLVFALTFFALAAVFASILWITIERHVHSSAARPTRHPPAGEGRDRL